MVDLALTKHSAIPWQQPIGLGAWNRRKRLLLDSKETIIWNPVYSHWFECTKQRGGVCNPIGVAFELFDNSAPFLWKCQLQPFALTADALNQALMPWTMALHIARRTALKSWAVDSHHLLLKRIWSSTDWYPPSCLSTGGKKELGPLSHERGTAVSLGIYGFILEEWQLVIATFHLQYWLDCNWLGYNPSEEAEASCI